MVKQQYILNGYLFLKAITPNKSWYETTQFQYTVFYSGNFNNQMAANQTICNVLLLDTTFQ